MTFLFDDAKVKSCILLLTIGITLVGCSSKPTKEMNAQFTGSKEQTSQTEADSKKLNNNPATIKINGIYKMEVMGELPKSIGLSSTDRKNIHANLGAIHKNMQSKYGFLGRLFYSTDSISGFELGGNTSIFDDGVVVDFTANKSPDKINIDKLVVVFYKEPSVESVPYVVAYSKLVDPKNRVNNINQVRFNGPVSKNDIIADVVAIIKKDDSYKLQSNSMSYDVFGELPDKLKDSAINQSDVEFPNVTQNRTFVVYMSVYEQNSTNNTIGVKIITYSPLS